jgi:hypothetical protein
MYKRISYFNACHLMRNAILLVTIIDVRVIVMNMASIVCLWLNKLNELLSPPPPVINENTNTVCTYV